MEPENGKFSAVKQFVTCICSRMVSTVQLSNKPTVHRISPLVSDHCPCIYVNRCWHPRGSQIETAATVDGAESVLIRVS
jgi:hypothetical protein